MGFLSRQVRKTGKRIKLALSFSQRNVNHSRYTSSCEGLQSQKNVSRLGTEDTIFEPIENLKEQKNDNPLYSEEAEQAILNYMMELQTQEYYDLISKSMKMRKELQHIEHLFNDISVQKGPPSIKTPKKSVTEITLLEKLEDGLQRVMYSFSDLKKRPRINSSQDVPRNEHHKEIDTSCQLRSISVSVERARPLSALIHQDEKMESSSSPLKRWRQSESPPEGFSSATAYKLLKSVFPVETLTDLEWDMGGLIAKHHTSASIFFSDIVGFTGWCSTVSPCQVIDCLSAYFQILDEMAERFGVYKVETIGDAWMAICGAPTKNVYHADCMAHFALEVLETLPDLKNIFESESITMRIGLHCGPVVSGIVRADRPRWQLFGDTVNMASRMESTGVPDRIQISQAMFKALSRAPTEFTTQSRGSIEIKGKGSQQTFFLTGVNKDNCRPESPASLVRSSTLRLTVFNPSTSRSGTEAGGRYSESSIIFPLRKRNKTPSANRKTMPDMQKEFYDMNALNEWKAGGLKKSKSFTCIRTLKTNMASSVDSKRNVRWRDDSDASTYAKERAILVVDDVASIRMQYCRLLKKMGFAMYTARNGDQALDLMRSKRFVLVLMDIKMPGMTGIECVRRFRNWECCTRSWKQPILAMSAGNFTGVLADTTEQTASSGFDGYFPKISKKSTIFKHVSKYLLRW